METQLEIYVAIDFGTAGSGFAWATNANAEPTVYNKWPKLKQGTHKTPTVLLLNPEEDFEAFGQEAIDKYHGKMVDRPDRFKDYYFFRNFKMQLYENKDVLSNLKIEALNGKCLPAITVFTLAIRYVKSEAIKWLDNLYPYAKKILWIITVPTKWSHDAKQVIKQAAKAKCDGKISDEETILVLEPEAAAIYCIKDNTIPVKPPQSISYMIVDCGGGTVDIVAHETTVNETKNISIVEICPPEGSNLGGLNVNHEFEELLGELCGMSVKEIQSKYPMPWDKIVYKLFENVKNHLSDGGVAKIEFKSNVCKYFKSKTGKTMKDLVKEYKDCKLSWINDDEDDDDDDDESGKLELPYSTIYRMFNVVIYSISVVINKALSKCSKIDRIVLVGGFSSSDLFYQEIAALLPDKLNVTRCKDPHLSVMKGAVLYGMDRKLIKSRKLPQSLGFETYVPFEKGIHADDISKKNIDGKDYCKVFLQCAEANKTVGQNDKFKRVFKSLEEGSTTCVFTLYGSQSATSKGYPVANFAIENLDSLPQDGKFEISLGFGGTEVQVSACSATNRDIELPVKLLNKPHSEEEFVTAFKLDITS